MSDHWMIGGAGTGADAAATNGGAYFSGEGGATGSWANGQGTNGGPVNEITGASLVNQGDATTLITKTGEFTNTVIGQWAYVSSALEGKTFWTPIVGVGGNNSISIPDPVVPWASDRADVVVNVGGALPATDVGVQIVIDNILMNHTSSLALGSSIRLSKTVECSTSVLWNALGSDEGWVSTNRLTVLSVDSDGVEIGAGDTRTIIQPAADWDDAGNDALFDIGSTTDCDFIDFKWLDFNCSANAKVADYGIYCNDATSEFIRIFECLAHDAGVNGIYHIGARSMLMRCQCYDCIAAGCFWDSRYGAVLSNKFYDNGTAGLENTDGEAEVAYNEAWGNGTIGIDEQASSDKSSVHNNTCYNNGSDGFNVHTDGDAIRFYNNVSAFNAAGYGYNLNSDIAHFNYFGNNLSFGNLKHSNDAAGDVITDADWADLGNGSWDKSANSFLNPYFANPTSTPPNFNIGNFEALFSGLVNGAGDPTTIGAGAIVGVGPMDRIRRRALNALYGYNL